MFYSIRGTLIHKEPNLAVVECAGVGFALRTTSNSLEKLKIGEEAKLKTHLYIREDAAELFGFADDPELNCFRMLLSVSGVGPKAALSVLSAMSPQNFALAVAGDDVKKLTGAAGIGAKTAGRIILELKDKISKQQGFEVSAKSVTSGIEGASGKTALNALMVLGFSAAEASGALSDLDGSEEGLDTPELIKRALKKLSGGRM